MQDDIETIDILDDVIFQNDITGPALFVLWRNVPVGIIRPLTANQITSWARKVPPEERNAFRNNYKELVGKWHDSLSGEQYFDTKEEAANELIRRALRKTSHSALIQAALRGDDAEVMRLRTQIRESPSDDE